MISLSARCLGWMVAWSVIALAAGPAMAQKGGGPTDKDTIGVFNPTTDTFSLRNANSTGAPNVEVSYGPADGIPLIGDWDGAGADTLGVYSPSLGRFLLRNANTPGAAQLSVNYGPTPNSNPAGLVPIVGDWDGVGPDTVGLYVRAQGRFLLRNTATSGIAEITTKFGPRGVADVVPLAGNWDGVGTTDGIGVFVPADGTFYLKNDASTSGVADITVRFGPKPTPANWVPVVGNWNNDTTDTIGLYDPTRGIFLLRNANTDGPHEVLVRFGPKNVVVPVDGNYDALP